MLPFYDDVTASPPTFTNGLDDTGGAFGNVQNRTMNGTYAVQWQVQDDIPIGQQNATVLSGLPAGNYTVSKLITVVVTRPGGNPLNVGEQLAQAQFVKTWAVTDIGA
jgi:hypothetical protein